MKNKYIYSLLFVSLLFLISIQFSSAQATSNFCNPTFKIVNQDPIPAIPNSYVKVVIEASNLNYCNGLSVELSPDYPFSLDSGVNAVQTLSSNPYAADYKSVWDIPYQIRVASDALEGDYNLKILYHDGAASSTSSTTTNLNISIQDVQTDFATVVQSVSGNQVSIGIVNTGKNTANSLIVSIPQQSSYRASGTSQQIVGNLAAGDYTLVSFTITSSRSFSGNYTGARNVSSQNSNANSPLSIQLDYTDGIGQRRSVVENISADNLIMQPTNSTARLGSFSRTTTTSSSSTWKYILVIALILIVGFIIYKNKEQVANFLKGKESSRHAPDWVESERKKK